VGKKKRLFPDNEDTDRRSSFKREKGCKKNAVRHRQAESVLGGDLFKGGKDFTVVEGRIRELESRPVITARGGGGDFPSEEKDKKK